MLGAVAIPAYGIKFACTELTGDKATLIYKTKTITTNRF
jgi:hypothetical protein